MSSKYKKSIYAIVLIGLGLLILWPTLQYQDFLSQGDHGRDLYVFERVLHGDLPYIDFWWVYGPLMPYYYGTFYLLFGISLSSILIGKMVLILGATLLIFLSLALFAPLPLSLLGGLYFILYQPDFFFTYNHLGGITALLGIQYCSFLFIKAQKEKYLMTALGGAFLLCLIKINFGLVALTALALTVICYTRCPIIPPTFSLRRFWLGLLLIVPSSVAIIYAFLLKDLPIYAIRQCLPYLGADHPHNAPLHKSLLALGQTIIHSIIKGPLPIFLFVLALLGLVLFFIKKPASCEIKLSKKFLLFALLSAGIMYLGNCHEFLASGVLYRYFWASPFSILILFLCLGHLTTSLSQKTNALWGSVIGLLLSLNVITSWQRFQEHTIPTQYFTPARGQIYLGNPATWLSTVTATTNFLQKNLNGKETFFALPYDTLYHFLTGKSSPTRQLIFFDHINIPPEQEERIIATLEQKQVNWIVLSNRANSPEKGLGLLGKDYCPRLAVYIKENFQHVQQFGQWHPQPGWAWNHSTRILKRCERFPSE